MRVARFRFRMDVHLLWRDVGYRHPALTYCGTLLDERDHLFSGGFAELLLDVVNVTAYGAFGYEERPRDVGRRVIGHHIAENLRFSIGEPVCFG